MAILPFTYPSIDIEVHWSLAPNTTVATALHSARQRLKEAQIEGASLDAQVILASLLQVERAWLFAHGDVELSARQADAFTELIVRRMRHEPVAYLTGHREFYGLDLKVDRRVLVPRPETEMLVDEVLREIESRTSGINESSEYTEQSVRIADIGTGSAAIALAIATNSPAARVYAIDISRGALAVARENVTRLDTRGQITLLRGDLLAPLPESVDIIVANLPYVSRSEYNALEPTVKHYEPRLALESGDEGLDAIARLLRHASTKLNQNGMIYLEIGWNQGDAVKTLARNVLPTARDIAVHRDYQGHQRMVVIAV